jgi:hypothetical protein
MDLKRSRPLCGSASHTQVIPQLEGIAMNRLNIEVAFDPANDGPQKAGHRMYQAVVESIRFVCDSVGTRLEAFTTKITAAAM